ncbi:hypothetical protein F6Q07_02430 [Pectobacterium parmentieri]|uniref:hypothetical protein n=1 Tax=Pectobacterium parmentieri TaxID=1905730 RepID=UPI000EAD115D|nr:hypothetical protein [Pectobacterium parmentieri]AYH01663.1 hypothetical protein C5E26_12340 [Pectobacterium parmentieri]AYH27930.1 hypothetical protein C5E20_12745 [Pectobacterium parmentieri]AYH32236.1 hypothetical protein C5E19_11775 [Pectobacterium parmentieri]MBI0516996.1 hypothetical protein [Pectobacterium parmentieri]
MLRQRIKPDQRAGEIDDVTPFRCLQTILNNKVLHSLCSKCIVDVERGASSTNDRYYFSSKR